MSDTNQLVQSQEQARRLKKIGHTNYGAKTKVPKVVFWQQSHIATLKYTIKYYMKALNNITDRLISLCLNSLSQSTKSLKSQAQS